MNEYVLVLGREADLSAAEIHAVFSAEKIKTIAMERRSNHLFVQVPETLPASFLMTRLGGTVSIGKKIPSAADAAESIAEYLHTNMPEGKIHFSLEGAKKNIAMDVKHCLKERDRSVRYVEPKNTATILHNNLLEKGGHFLVLPNGIFATEAIQPFEAFSARDYGRPGRDSKRGMLPPKLARMMINLAAPKNDAIILDPFCGSGTILTEAMLMGYRHLIGSDTSSDAIGDSKKNIQWTQSNNNGTLEQWNNTPIQLIVSPAQNLHKKLKPHSIDTIITEPYLGKPLWGDEPQKAIEKQAEELGTLYTHAFQAFAHVLKPGGIVIFLIPAFRHKDTWIRVRAANSIQKNGFTPVPFDDGHDHLLYSRPDQHVGREIWKFKKTPPT